MEENSYKFELQFLCQQFDNFKQKAADMCMKMIGGSMLALEMKFGGYGQITFAPEDTRHQFAEIVMLSEFNRNRTNAIVYDILPTSDMYAEFDKVFIYYTDGKAPTYGYVKYDTRTGRSVQKFQLAYEDDELCRSLKQALNMSRKKLSEL